MTTTTETPVPAPAMTPYSGPLWASAPWRWCGRDDETGAVICDCSTFERTGTCRHAESVIKHNRPDATWEFPDDGETTEFLLGGTWDLTDWPGPGLGVMPRRVGGATVTLRRVM